MGWGQAITGKVDLSNYYTKSQVDSIARLSGKPPVIVVPPIITLLPCESGPSLRGIYSISQTSITPNFYGVGVTGIAWKIYTSTDTAAIRKGSFSPTSDKEPISFESLAPGSYILQYSGTTCKGSDTRAFTIPKLTGDVTPNPPRVPADQTGKVYELILNLTGEGFESTYWDNVQKKYVENTTGIKESGYIDKFKLKDGSYTITGTRIAMPWFEFEKTPGNYEIEGVKRMIKWHRERGLSLSICFLPWRRYGDGFFGPGSFMKGNRGGTFYPVSITDDPVYNQTMASYWDEQTNAKIKEAVRVLSQVLGTYEKAGYIGLGSGRGEEYVMPNFESWILKPSPLNNWGRKIVESSDLSDQFMLKFKQWVEKRGLTPYRRPDFDSENGYLDASNEIGKEYMRFCTYTLRKYFDNFADGVREGSTKVNVCFFIPSVGTHLNANELVAYFSYIAKNADELYHSDGAFAWDNERKTNGVRVFRGTFPDKPASAEIDPQDAGYQPGWGTGEVTTEQFTGLALNIWKAGGMRVHMAMKYLDNSVARVNEGASRMRQYTGKPYSPPAVTSNNTVIIDITKDPHNVFKNNTLYDDTFKATPDTYVKQIETLDFWGGVAPDSEL